MKDIRNSIRQMLRTPVRSVLFLCLLALSVCLLSVGVHLRSAGEEQMRVFEAGFTTIGTVRQVQNALETRAQWDAGDYAYSYYSSPVYDAVLPSSVLNFDGANYIHSPEKRPYYGAYDPNFVIFEPEHVTQRKTQWEEQILIIEVQPLEDCVPVGPVRLKVNRVLYGKLTEDEIWFCNHFTKDPPPMLAGKTYVMTVQPMPLLYAH